jgi:hypothetical protein
VFVVPVAPAAGAGEADAGRRGAKRPDYVAPVAAGAVPDVVVEGDDVLVEVEEAGEEVAAGDEETFLVTEEDESGDMSGIIGGTAPEGDEEV